MCGRYFLDIHDASLQQWLQLVPEDFAYHEVFPSNQALVLTYDKQIQPTIRSWGFLKWDSQQRIINARAETISTSSFFKSSFQTSRAIVLASGFYEWDSNKIRHILTPTDDTLLYMAGVLQAETGNFAILTQPATAPVSMIHHRQPLLLTKENMKDYLEHRLHVSMVDYHKVDLVDHPVIEQASLF